MYGIVKQHKGWVEVMSELGKGSTFKVFFPCEKPTQPAAQESSSLVSEEPGDRRTILLVEDEPAVAEVARSVLQEEGYLVLEANDGLGALQIWNDHRGQIDLLLTDIKMPHGMSGLDLADNLRALKPELKIIYTSGCNPEILHAEFQSGKDNFLAKPFSPAHLQQIVRTGLDLPAPEPMPA